MQPTKSALAVATISIIILTLFSFAPVNAQTQLIIVINADGTVSPSTAPIERSGDLYTLTADITGTVAVLRSNMTFEGNGHTLTAIGDLRHGREGFNVGLNAYSETPVLTGASNVTVRGLNVVGGIFGITLMNTANSTVFNNTVSGTGNAYYSIEQQSSGIYVERANNNTVKLNNLSSNYNGILFVESTGNIVVGNTIAYCANNWGSSVGIAFWDAPNNKVYHNNFINNTNNAYGGVTVGVVGTAPLAANSWDNGYPSGGNYWSDYQTKYPNAEPLNGTAIGNIAYEIDQVNKDSYPLLEAYDVASEPTPAPSTPLSTEQATPLAPILLATATIVILVIAGLAVYLKKVAIRV